MIILWQGRQEGFLNSNIAERKWKEEFSSKYPNPEISLHM